MGSTVSISWMSSVFPNLTASSTLVVKLASYDGSLQLVMRTHLMNLAQCSPVSKYLKKNKHLLIDDFKSQLFEVLLEPVCRS